MKCVCNSALMFVSLRNGRRQRSKAGDNWMVPSPFRHSFYKLLTRTDGFLCNLRKPPPCTRVSNSAVQCFPSWRTSWGVTNSDRNPENIPFRPGWWGVPYHLLSILYLTQTVVFRVECWQEACFTCGFSNNPVWWKRVICSFCSLGHPSPTKEGGPVSFSARSSDFLSL